MSFDISALNAFRNAKLVGEDAIARIGLDNSITQKGSYYGGIGRVIRLGKAQTANNAVRAELLRSLGNAFGLDGITEKGGKLHFSADFMAKLEKLIGRSVLKTGDFDLGADGSVTSGKPLTQRRIDAIISKAIKAGGEFDVKGYGKKLAKIQEEVKGKGKNAVLFYTDVKRALDFYKNEIDRVIIKNDDYDPNAGEINEDEIIFDEDRDEQARKRSPFLMFDYGKGHYVPLQSGGQLRDHLNSETIANNPLNMFIHLENALKINDTRIHNERDFNHLKGYLKEVVRNYVQLSIDCYLASKESREAGHAFETFLSNYNHCLDGRATELNLYAMKYLPPEAPAEHNGPAAPGEDELKIPANMLPDHTEKNSLEECLYKEIYAVKAALPDSKGWEDIAGAIKKRMAGLTRPISTLDEKGDIVPLKVNGNAVVRPVTAEDIDRIGPKCCEISFAFA